MMASRFSGMHKGSMPLVHYHDELLSEIKHHFRLGLSALSTPLMVKQSRTETSAQACGQDTVSHDHNHMRRREARHARSDSNRSNTTGGRLILSCNRKCRVTCVTFEPPHITQEDLHAWDFSSGPKLHLSIATELRTDLFSKPNSESFPQTAAI
jgi:hypothetical protein